MTPERFQQIGELYHSVREANADQRVSLLAQADPELRREVESLLATHPNAEWVDRPAIQVAAPLLDDADTSGLEAGSCLGPYRIEHKLGEGGMGEVFAAVDTRLGRTVAIKITQERFSARFAREARAIAALNHPHICTLHDVGPNYIVMELVEGETMAARLKNGPLPMKTALLYASQIAAALVEAHGKGIIHRDLKPGNMMIARSGVKVLDFGLARSSDDETAATESRIVMGTPAYMAPEQREGKAADARTDIYSFGCVLYEMLTAARVGSPKRIPSRSFEKIVNRCLEEDPARRWQSIAELEREIGKLTTRSVPWKAGSAAAIILALLVLAYPYVNRAPRLTDKDTIVLADFDNKTGDPVFDDTLRQGLAVELQQSPILDLISDAQIRQTLPLMGLAKDGRLTSEIAQQVCERTGSAALLEGSIASLGSQYVLGLRAKNCITGRILDQEQIQAARREDVLNSLSQIARKFRTRVGESLATVESHSTPLPDATTSSLDALKAYATGMKLTVFGDPAAGIVLLRRAVEIDPQFAIAYANLGLDYSTIDASLSTEYVTKAWQLRERGSERERFFIEVLYHRQVTGNLEKAYKTLESWLQVYPRAHEPPSPIDLLGGLSTQGTGRYDRAIEISQKLVATRPDIPFGYGNLASSYFFSGHLPEAERTLQQAFERKLENANQLVMRYNIALLTDDKDQMERIVARAKSKPGGEHRLAHAQALALARSGRFEAARQSSNRAVDLARQEGQLDRAATYRAARALWEAVGGNAAEGKRSAVEALELSKRRDVQYAAGLALAFSGDISRSEAVADDLEKRFPEDTFVKFTYVPVLRAKAALERGKPADSVEALRIALPYEAAVNDLNHDNFYLGGLHSAYVRGEAFIAQHRYADAVAEFQKILEHRGIVGADLIGALAHLQLGRAFALLGAKTKAKSAYDDFFKLWSEPDPDIPVLKQARAEYALR